MRIHLNGVKVAELSLPFPYMNSQAPLCTVGNSAGLNYPFNGNMRHLVFSLAGFDSNQNISSIVRSVPVPSDQNVLAYFQFQQGFSNQETYYFNASRQYTV